MLRILKDLIKEREATNGSVSINSTIYQEHRTLLYSRHDPAALGEDWLLVTKPEHSTQSKVRLGQKIIYQ